MSGQRRAGLMKRSDAKRCSVIRMVVTYTVVGWDRAGVIILLFLYNISSVNIVDFKNISL